GSGADFANTITVDAQGNAFVTGYTLSANFPTKGPLQGNLSAGTDAFVAKLNATGNALVYSTYLGGSAYDNGVGIALDASGSVYVIGWSNSDNFPTTAGAFQT